jgi:hypothetical protein
MSAACSSSRRRPTLHAQPLHCHAWRIDLCAVSQALATHLLLLLLLLLLLQGWAT